MTPTIAPIFLGTVGEGENNGSAGEGSSPGDFFLPEFDLAMFDQNASPVLSATQVCLGAVKLSDSRLASNPAILEALSLHWEDDAPVSPCIRDWEAAGSRVVDTVIAPVLEDFFGQGC